MIKKTKEQMSVQINKKIVLIPTNTYFCKIGEKYHFKTLEINYSLDAETIENSDIFEPVEATEYLKEVLIEKMFEIFDETTRDLHSKFFGGMKLDEFQKQSFILFGNALYPGLVKEGWSKMLFRSSQMTSTFDESVFEEYIEKEYYKKDTNE